MMSFIHLSVMDTLHEDFLEKTILSYGIDGWNTSNSSLIKKDKNDTIFSHLSPLGNG